MDKSIPINITKLCALTHPEEFDKGLLKSYLKRKHGNKIEIAGECLAS